MKGLEIFFPPFDRIICDPLLEKFLICKEKPNIKTFSYDVIIEEYMPPNSAFFLQDKNIVAIYLNGRLSFNKAKIKNLGTIFADFHFLKGNIKKGE